MDRLRPYSFDKLQALSIKELVEIRNNLREEMRRELQIRNHMIGEILFLQQEVYELKTDRHNAEAELCNGGIDNE